MAIIIYNSREERFYNLLVFKLGTLGLFTHKITEPKYLTNFLHHLTFESSITVLCGQMFPDTSVAAKFSGIIQLSDRLQNIPFQNDKSNAGPTGLSDMICLEYQTSTTTATWGGSRWGTIFNSCLRIDQPIKHFLSLFSLTKLQILCRTLSDL